VKEGAWLPSEAIAAFPLQLFLATTSHARRASRRGMGNQFITQCRRILERGKGAIAIP
jgi:hypothetical protein